MKRVSLLPVLGLCLCLVACGSKASAPKTANPAEESSQGAADSSTASERATEADSKDSEATAAGGAESTTDKSQSPYDIWRDYIDGKDKSEITLDEESEKLYSGFINGEVASEFSEDCSDFCDQFELSSEQKSYTLPEIESLIQIDRNNIPENDEYLCENYLDLGLDGSYELMVDIYNEEDPHGYGLSLIVKNFGGKLKICYIQDCWARQSAVITYSGMIYVSGSGGAMTHGGFNGYLDAEGKYHLWYEWDESIYETEYDPPEEDVTINGIRIGGDDIRVDVDRYTFYDNKKYITVDVEYRYPEDEHGEDATDLEDAYKKACEAFVDPDETLCTIEEIEDILKDYRKKLGISDEVYTYGDELKPEDD
ncbi:hypothetical protein [Butyrivibrio sp. INlla21]|uniref:hypothetical protein n=1 Tax=Butyrivibrio sp. INlla21 TaxID=1520811 RepID=UPI0008F13983|nr:hypothetical protein [Butyrivibrio sp. INlla21]SFU70753.1 hypothetical protein SAMN02910342_01451 [Butyrivibrio sp. INlla21]